TLAHAPRPSLAEPLAPYEEGVFIVRHERSQGGVATAGLARVEAEWFAAQPVSSSGKAINSILQRLPKGMIGALGPLVPAGVKRRIRAESDWDRLEEDRRWEDRWAAAQEQLASTPPPESPKTMFVVPCYNQGAFVRQALISVVGQTDPDWGVIIVDDGSDDDETIAILDAIDLPGVTVYRQENKGLSAARNAGISATSSKYIVPLDADDLVDPGFLAALVGRLEADPGVGYAHCWARLFGDLDAVWATRPVNPYQLLLSNSVVGCVLMRRDAWELVGGYDESMKNGNEDWDLWIRMGAARLDGVQVPQPLFWYRKHGVSMSVETESNYEDALTDLAARLPGIYARPVMQSIKNEAYPLLSILVEGSLDPWVVDDVQPIEILDGDIATAAGSVRAKYVVALSADARIDLETLLSMCNVLEQNPELGQISTTSDEPVAIVRSWSLDDPTAPSAQIEFPSAATSSIRLGIGQLATDQAAFPTEIEGIRVIRQRPEETGILPDWIP
ncbi:MAG: glycosyltransferase family 2 protein, partial [Acidimicrobiia bacterium]